MSATSTAATGVTCVHQDRIPLAGTAQSSARLCTQKDQGKPTKKTYTLVEMSINTIEATRLSHMQPCNSYYHPDRPGTPTTVTKLAKSFSKQRHPAGASLAAISRSRASSLEQPEL